MGNENTKLCENCRDGLIGSALGMTLRDYFAAKAMQGLLANPGGPIQANGMSGWNWCNCTVESVADFAWHIADAMLKAREASNG